ncbi:MAG TPA: DNA repair protein RadC [Rectinemataceae bacterium]|nr:DNA repair protein RadC [Rectinemataceae bacterium]
MSPSIYDASRPSLVTERPSARERLARQGPAYLGDAELLAAVLGTGMKGKGVLSLAEEVLSLVEPGSQPPDAKTLCSLAGMGEAKAAAISAALELGKRLYGIRERRISSPRDLHPLIAHWADRKQERFICASLNGAHELIAIRVVSIGLVNRTVVHPREVFADPIVDRACAVIVAHNHPSGRLEPSPEDMDITKRLRKAGEVIGIDLLDHLIFDADAWLSLVERGLLAPVDPD